jgi:uncharacterized cupredoxin-like copper-binding protein
MTIGTAGRWIAAAVTAGAVGAAGVSLAATKPPTKLSLQADPGGDLKFTKSKLSTKARRITLVMKNPSSSGTEHGIAIDGHGLDKEGKIVAAGKTSKVTVSVKPGKYTYYCPVEGHRQLGMKGKLTVN